jgi:CRISPR/Cas system-associated protein Cas5 (RAMP superfamily)
VQSEISAVVLSWAAIRVGCPKNQVSLSEVHNKTTEICHAKSVAWTNRVIFPGFL